MVEIIERAYRSEDLADLGVKEVIVIIPAHNSESRILGVLANLAGQPLPDEVTLIVWLCANACRDNTAEAARRGLERLHFKRPNSQVNLIVTDTPGQANALNVMMEAAGRPGVVIELQDDVFPTKGALATLAGVMAARPELGAVSVVNTPIPTYKGRWAKIAEKFAYLLRTRENYSQKGYVDRMAAFRPGLVGEYPDVVSVDNYAAQAVLSRGYEVGVIQSDAAQVFYRLPKTFKELLKQEDMYVKGTKQIQRWWEENEIKVFKGHRRGKLRRLVNKVNKVKDILIDTDVSMTNRIGLLGIHLYSRTVARAKDIIKPYRSAIRERIESSV